VRATIIRDNNGKKETTARMKEKRNKHHNKRDEKLPH
jgi:hypothetical protein